MHPQAKTLISYLDTTHDSFDARPFCEADAFVLSVASYVLFENAPQFAKSNDPVTVREALMATPKEKLSDLFWFNELAPEFARALGCCPRYRTLKVSDAAHTLNDAGMIQFAAQCFHVPDGSLFLSFRGTDSTIAGWEEDFTMVVLDTIPAQHVARAFTERMIGKWKPRALRLGGHSKGGNLAFAAALMGSARTQNTITAAYNFDGPGFKLAQVHSEAAANIRDRCHKIIPTYSFFGQMFEDLVEPRTIVSTEHGIMQHMPFSWPLENDALLPAAHTQFMSRVTETGVSSWLDRLTEEERVNFCGVLFGLMEYASRDGRIDNLPQDLLAKAPAIVRLLMGESKETQHYLLSILVCLSEELAESLRQALQSSFQGAVDETRQALMSLLPAKRP